MLRSWAVPAAAPPAHAQFLPPLQAEAPEEYDAYLDVTQAAAPQALIEAARRFEQSWPKSSLLADVRQLQFEAYTKRGRPAAAIRAARQALTLAPDNHTVRAGLALILANQASIPGQLEEAEREARTTLERLTAFVPPRSLPYPRWEQAARRVRGQAHAALGLVAFKRDRMDEAVRELETSVSLTPDPPTQYRLGRLYRLVGRLGEARKSLTAASAGGDPAVADLARRELREMER